jgi:hypothetical protein
MENILIDKRIVKDKLGWPSAEAFISIWYTEEDLNKVSVSKNGIDPFTSSSSSHVIKYKGNYWGDNQMQRAGLDSRPLAFYEYFPAEEEFEKNEAGEYKLDDKMEKIPTGEVIPEYKEWVSEFTVDMGHVQAIQVKNGSLTGDDECKRLIEDDIKRRFPKSIGT